MGYKYSTMDTNIIVRNSGYLFANELCVVYFFKNHVFHVTLNYQVKSRSQQISAQSLY